MNVGRKPVFVLDQDCAAVTDRIIREVEKAGMQAMRSFDLGAVRESHQGFCCPIHGSSTCSCQLVILLIFMPARGCARVILEGSDQKTSVFLDAGLDDTEEQIDLPLTSALTQALFH